MSKNLEMSIFDSDDNFELNIEDNLPADFFVNNDADDINDDDSSNDYGEDDSLDDDTNLNDGDSDDDSQEDVVKKDALENEGGEDDDSDSPNIFSPFATVLKEQGLLPSLSSDSKIENIEDLTNAFKSEIDNQVKSYLVEKIGEDGVNALEKGITLAEYQQYKNGVDTLNNIDSESLSINIELSKNIILQDYISQGLSEEKAYRFLQKTIELGDDAIIEDAKQSLESLKHIQEIKLEKAKESRQAEMIAEQKAQEKIDNDLKNSIFNSNEIIQGLTMTKAMKENVYKSITNIVSKSPDGIAENKLMRHRREDPIEFDKKLYYLYELTNQFKDFSSLVSKSKTKATSEFEKILRSNKSQIQNGLPSFANDPDSYGGIGDEIVFD